MSDQADAAPFNFHTLPEDQQLCFAGALFAMSAADREMDDAETERIVATMELSGLSEEGRRRILAQAIQPPPLERCLIEFRDTGFDVRRALMRELIGVVLADDSIEPGEHLGLLQARRILDLSHDDVAELHDEAYAATRAAGQAGTAPSA
ncbi:MAG TPA: hypothetical protein VK610_05115 [Rhodothermales bacterium]|nr:hypothetical protein [Rhodothermales bacterium]